jgi:uncharacterized protein YeeX (DUF496 family)
MLKMTGVQIEPLKDMDMVLFLESSIRGGVSFINERHFKAGPVPPPAAAAAATSAEEQLITSGLYADSNNLYGYAQSCMQPTGGYRWMTMDEILRRDWTRHVEGSQFGYILEVDLDYPPELHLLHNSLPLAPHRMHITEEHLSPYALECLLRIKGKVKHESHKLVTTFLPRRNYVVHAANLALYLQLGMKLVNIHRVLTFTQSDFLKKYIDFCTRKRAESTSESRKQLFKNFSNSNFGKFIEQTRDHLDVKLLVDDGTTSQEEAFKKWATNPRYKCFKVFPGAKAAAVFLKRRTVHMKQAWAIGFTILERSKGLVYNHYYNFIAPALDNRCSVLMTDTDSLALRITTSLDKMQVMEKLKPIMDFSNYPKDHPLYSSARQNQLGYWKDELRGDTLEEFAGLASKTYCMQIASADGEKTDSHSKCKGVKKGYRRAIPFEDYKKCVIGIEQVRVKQYTIQSKNHVIATVAQDRLAFSSFDDKRYILPCGKHSVPYGSRLIRISEALQRCVFC